MSGYIGQPAVYGRFRKIDSIAGSFNGVTTSFALTVASVAYIPSNALQLLVVTNGIVREPGVDYTVNGSNLVFAVAPTGGWSFHAVLYGDTGFLPVAGTASYVTEAAQPNITSVGTLTSLGSSGVITASRFTSNVTTGTAPLTVTSTTQVANLNVANAGHSTTANTVVDAAQANITSVGTLTVLGVNGVVTSTRYVSNIATGTAPFTVSSTTQVANLNAATAGTATSATTAGTVTTAAQPNITSVGTLTSLTTSGNISINAASSLRLMDSDSSHFTALVANGTVSANLTLTLPIADGAANGILKTNGSAVLAFANIVNVVTTTTYASGTGTFTANAASTHFFVVCTGGGGGGGAADSDATSSSAAGGGGGGGTAIKWFTRAQMGATASYSVGTAGTAGSGNGGNGLAGGNSTFTPSGTGGVLTGNGGALGVGTGSAYANTWSTFAGGAGGTASGGDINIQGVPGKSGMGAAGPVVLGGDGGNSFIGQGAKGPGLNAAGNTAGVTATTAGGGGSGGINTNSATSVNGGAGAVGTIIVVEYILG